MGRQYNFPVALEGALKLKEISYIHAEGYPSAEMKHGPIALISPDFPSVFVVPRDAMYDKNMSNVEEIKARKGPIIAVATEGDEEIARKADDVIYIPRTVDLLQPAPDGGPAATIGLPHRRPARLRRGQAPQPRQERDRRIAAQARPPANMLALSRLDRTTKAHWESFVLSLDGFSSDSAPGEGAMALPQNLASASAGALQTPGSKAAAVSPS